MSIFDEDLKKDWLTEAVKTINEQYGNFAMFVANALEEKRAIKHKISFGRTEFLSYA